MLTTPALSIVIPVCNAESTIGEQMEALARQHWERDWELIVADNRCTDRTLDVVESYRDRFTSLRVVDASGRRGGGHAMNVGARAARARSVAFCDADDVVASGWVAAIGRALDRHEFVASRHEFEKLNPKPMLSVRSPEQTDGPQILWYPPYCRHAGACGMGLRRSRLLELGGFDEGLQALYDTDLSIRMHRRGIDLAFVPDAVIHVRYRRSAVGLFEQSRCWAVHNALLCRRYLDGWDAPAGGWQLYRRSCVRALKRVRSARRRADLRGLAWKMGRLVGLLQGALQYRLSPLMPESAAPRTPASKRAAVMASEAERPRGKGRSGPRPGWDRPVEAAESEGPP